MSFDGLLNKIAIIEKATMVQDAGGQQVKTWATHKSGVNCRLSGRGGDEKRSQNMFDYYSATDLLFMREITGFTLNTREYRFNIVGTIYNIKHIDIISGQVTTNHIEIYLEKVE